MTEHKSSNPKRYNLHWEWMAEDPKGEYVKWEDYERLQSETPVHRDPTGRTREPPHCPSCSCGMPADDADSRPHSDDLAVDRFAAAMKAKLAKKRADGRSGWDDPAQCPVPHLAQLLIGHLAKGDPVDIGNLAMMLFNREGGAEALKRAAQEDGAEGHSA
jgi:hypothetical protein